MNSKRGTDYIILFLFSIVSLCRTFKFSGNISIVLMTILLLILVLNRILSKSLIVSKYDLYWLLLVTLIIFHSPDVAEIVVIFGIMGILFMAFARGSIDSFKGVLDGILVVGLANLIVNAINMINPQIYLKIIKALLDTNSYRDAEYSWNIMKHLNGLSDHYSRNAYYCVAGFSVGYAKLLSGKEKKKVPIILFTAVSYIMIMIIGKRGHLLFMTGTALFIYLIMEPKFSKRILRLLQFITVGSFALAVLLTVMPSAGYVFERSIAGINSGDISMGRFLLYERALEIFKMNPLFGIGYGGFASNSTLFLGSFYAGVHNDYLQWLAELGIAGFLLNIIPAFSLYFLCLKEVKFCIKNIVEKNSKLLIIWSATFQTFVLFYSLTGLPHFDYEINMIYMLSLSIPIVFANKYGFMRKKIKIIKLR